MAGPSLFDRGPLVTTLALTALGLSMLNMATLLKYQFGSNESVICRAMPFQAPSPPMLFEREDGPRHETPRRYHYRYRHHRPEELHGPARFQTLFLTEPTYHEAPRFKPFRYP